MAAEIQILIRTECPPGACTCERDGLLQDPQGDRRILMLTQAEEKRLIARIEAIETYDELKRIVERIHAQLGVRLHIAPGDNEVKTVSGFDIHLDDHPGLCRKTRAAIPAAVRRCLKSHPSIAYAILDAHDLFGI
ncbi:MULTISPECIES: hypothetical protein [Pandoraea]|uniref:Ribosomal protein S3AE n=1 Tax=Pandoraea pnomenusa TaxID=93220 RepID=A0A378YIY0_9BURK|nr:MULTISPECIES: hypothetical protein [Pandoraea]AHB04927.1 ribosomal protein S3AE [Pandoraea pnomenusa 3kgm]AHB74702.2 ribosomal protein S3AE [Pandoraea pnomenusa]AIU26503.1 ribosomal protein S3AE [Pandoraea pnomenusa]QDH60905.1 hypothetical protein FKQ53_17615 [Pandoraea pnomenusa]SUA76788.1 Uncharacterised protein [Pandoraea pnomenusa]